MRLYIEEYPGRPRKTHICECEEVDRVLQSQSLVDTLLQHSILFDYYS